MNNNEFRRRILMTVFGVLICGMAVGMFQFSAMGMDPFQVFAHGISAHIHAVGFGTVYMILNVILLVIDFFLLDKHKIGIATFINLFLLGYVVEFSDSLLQKLIPNPTLTVRVIILLIAIVILCLASALYFTGDLGVSTYDAVALSVSEKWHLPFKFVRITTDVICVVIGTVLGVLPGVGTIITAFFMGPLIEYFNVHVAQPLRYGKKAEQRRAALAE